MPKFVLADVNRKCNICWLVYHGIFKQKHSFQ